MSKANRMLIIDDNEISRDILREIFREDYDVLEASNGADGLDLVTQYCDSLAVILLDLVMPKMDGYEFIERMSRKNLLVHIPVIVISADRNDKIESSLLNHGVADMITSPISRDTVLRRVENVVSASFYRQNLEHITQVLRQRLQKSNEMFVDTLSSIIEHRSLESGLHIKRIRSFTDILLRKLQEDQQYSMLDEETIETISQAATLHDVGKIVIPDSILNKPGRFTDEEFSVMKTHTTEGGNIIKKLNGEYQKDYLDYAWQIAMYHHERWDGKGYPEGLSGDSIPLCAQVVGIADVYDALTTPRVYKPAISHGKAITMILSGECGQFSEKINHALRSVAPQFEELARQYRDGEKDASEYGYETIVIDDEFLEEAYRSDYFKYLTALRAINGIVYEINYDNRSYRLMWPKRSPFERMPLCGELIADVQQFIDVFCHPEDCMRITAQFEKDRESINSGKFSEHSTFMRLRPQRNKPFKWYRVQQARIELQSTQYHKSLIIFTDIDDQVKAGLIDVSSLEVAHKKLHYETTIAMPEKNMDIKALEKFASIGCPPDRLFSMFRSLCDAVFVMNIDSGNLAFEFSSESVRPLILPATIKEFKNDIHPDDKDLFMALFEMIITGTEPPPAIIRLNDGQGRYVSFKIQMQCTSVKDATPSHILGLMVCTEA
ncbi:MAG: response regulator [Treponema sp.]|nr:response regulator [Candidatus Treponema caballi]